MTIPGLAQSAISFQSSAKTFKKQAIQLIADGWPLHPEISNFWMETSEDGYEKRISAFLVDDRTDR